MNYRSYVIPGRYFVALPVSILGYLFTLEFVGDAPLYLFAALKILPIGLLVTLVDKLATSGGRNYSRYAFCVAFGLLASAAGDVMLEMEPSVDHELLFLGGLGSFLTAHWIYIFGMWSGGDNFAPVAAVVAYSFAVGFFSLLDSHTPTELKIPVAAYAFSIATMAWAAARRLGSKSSSQTSQYLGFVGAVLFVISDSILGYNKFAVPIPNAKFLVMVTYYSAQCCIALSTNGLVDTNGPSKRVR